MSVLDILRRVSTSILLCVCSCQVVRAGDSDCVGKYVAQAEFGRELGTPKNVCPGVPSGEEQDCTYDEGGIRYGISQGLMVNKEVTPKTYSRPLPFGLAWGEKRDVSERKITKVTGGDPKLSMGADRDGPYAYLGDPYCLLTKSGHGYHLELYFDNDSGGLFKIIGRILYP